MKLEHKTMVRLYAKTLQEANIPHEKIYVYGSVAKGKENPWSDIDLAVIGPAFGTDLIEEMVTLRMLAQEINPAISPMPLRPEDLEDRFSTLGQTVRKEGYLV